MNYENEYRAKHAISKFIIPISKFSYAVCVSTDASTAGVADGAITAAAL